MKTKYSNFTYLLAIISGFIVLMIANIEPFPIPLIIFCFLVAGAFGYIWPIESWRWTFWMIGPSFALTILSIAFTGQLDVYLEKDLPVFLIAITTAFSGSMLFAVISNKRNNKVDPVIQSGREDLN